VDRLISVKVVRVVIGALDPDHRGNGLRKLAHSPTIEVALFPAALRADARELIQEWKEFSEKQQQTKASTNPENGELAKKQKELKTKVGTAMKQASDLYDSFISAGNGKDFSEVDRKADEWINQTYTMLNEADEPADAEAFSQVRHLLLSREQLDKFGYLPEWKRERVARFSHYRHALNHIKETKRL
jgi:hypothetical protein